MKKKENIIYIFLNHEINNFVNEKKLFLDLSFKFDAKKKKKMW